MVALTGYDEMMIAELTLMLHWEQRNYLKQFFSMYFKYNSQCPLYQIWHLTITENNDVVQTVSSANTNLANRAIIITVAYHENLPNHFQQCNTVWAIAAAGGLCSQASERRVHGGGRGRALGGAGTNI